MLIEMLLGSLDLRASAALAGSPMLLQLTELLVLRTREELQKVADSGALSPVPDCAAEPARQAERF